jgi:hypothetical protein
MSEIINFIKEALAGKKMDAKWIVTIAVVIGGLIYGGMVLLQEYETLKKDVVSLKGSQHSSYSYDDKWIRALSENNMNNIIRLQTKQNTLDFSAIIKKVERLGTEVKNLTKDVDRNRDAVTSTGNPLSM